MKLNRNMKYTQLILKLILVAVLSLNTNQTEAQQQRVDSIIQLLNKSIKGVQVDSTDFTRATILLDQTSLNIKQIAQLESEAVEEEEIEDDIEAEIAALEETETEAPEAKADDKTAEE